MLSDLDGMSITGKTSLFSWNGKSMKRSYSELTEEQKELNEGLNALANGEVEDDQSLMGQMMGGMKNSMSQMLGMGKYIVRYHFSKPIKSVNVEYDELSADKKSVTFSQPGTTYLNPQHEEIIIDLK